MGDILLKNTILGGRKADVAISGGLISKICFDGGIEESEGAQIMDCRGMTLMPGFINMHTHAAMTLMRGLGEDMCFHDWIAKIWDIESRIDDEFVYWGTKVAALEMIRTGTTTFNNAYWSIGHAVEATRQMGLKSFESFVLLDHGDPEEAARQKDQLVKAYEESASWGTGTRFAICVHAVYSVSEPLMIWAKEFADRHDLTIHIHISETEKEVEDCKKAHGGLSPVGYLDRLGVLDSRTMAAHVLWISDEDVRILGDRKVNCVHNINSNMKLASGYHFLYKELREAGANICLGTDGCASSNNLDMLEAMKTSAIMEKAWRRDPSALPLNELEAMATVNGANALRINTGIIEEGRIADLLLINTGSSFFLSDAPFLANFVYSAHSDCIDSVISDGKFVMKHREIPGEEDILRNARKVLDKMKV